MEYHGEILKQWINEYYSLSSKLSQKNMSRFNESAASNLDRREHIQFKIDDDLITYTQAYLLINVE
jgi:hypothetical protein